MKERILSTILNMVHGIIIPVQILGNRNPRFLEFEKCRRLLEAQERRIYFVIWALKQMGDSLIKPQAEARMIILQNLLVDTQTALYEQGAIRRIIVPIFFDEFDIAREYFKNYSVWVNCKIAYIREVLEYCSPWSSDDIEDFRTSLNSLAQKESEQRILVDQIFLDTLDGLKAQCHDYTNTQNAPSRIFNPVTLRRLTEWIKFFRTEEAHWTERLNRAETNKLLYRTCLERQRINSLFANQAQLIYDKIKDTINL